MKNKISQRVIENRVQLLATAQFKNVIKNNKSKINKTFDVLPETISGNKIYCRAYFQAPEIDNTIIINKNKNIDLGKFTKVIIKDYKDYDLIAK